MKSETLCGLFKQYSAFVIAILFVCGICVSGCTEKKPLPGDNSGIMITPTKWSRAENEKLGDFDTVYLAVQDNDLLFAINPANNHYAPEIVGNFFRRQLFQEALLIAARDEVGALTRSELLGESPSQNGKTLSLIYDHSSEQMIPDPNIKRNFIKQITPEKNQVVIKEIECNLFFLNDDEYFKFFDQLERLSREDLAETLKKAGVTAHANSRHVAQENKTESPDTIPEEIQKRLEDLTLSSQFDAVRQLHQLIREKGESLALLSGLVRGYSQLFLLTEHHGLTSHYAYQGRAILYAQRAIAKYGESYETLSLRGSALSSATFFGLARKDFERADRQSDKQVSPEHEKWFAQTRAFADYDYGFFEKQVEETPKDHTARLLLFMLYHFSLDNEAIENQGKQLTNDFPCVKIYDGIYEINSFDAIPAPNGEHYTTYYGMNMPKQVRGVQGIPERVVEATKQRTADEKSSGLFGMFGSSSGSGTQYDRAKEITEALCETADDAEMSWGVLAQLIRNEMFYQVYYDAKQIAGHNGNPAALIKASAVITEKHPFHDIIACLSRNTDDAVTARKQIMDNPLEYSWADMGSYPFWLSVIWAGRTKAWSAFYPYTMACARMDHASYRETLWVWKCYYVSAKIMPPFVRDQRQYSDYILRMAPNSSFSAVVWLALNKDMDQERVERWKTSMTRSPSLLREFTKFYDSYNFPQEHEKLLRDIYKYSGTGSDMENLAIFMFHHGQKEEAIALAVDYLETPDAGKKLSAYMACELIARFYMDLKDFEHAVYYAEMASRAYSARGLKVMAECCEAMGDSERAGEYYERNAKNYSVYASSVRPWLTYCQRLDPKNFPRAKAAVMNVFETTRRTNGNLGLFVNYFAASGLEFPKECGTVESIFRESRDFFSGLRSLLVALEDENRDEKRIAELFSLLLKEDQLGDPRRELATLDHARLSFANALKIAYQQENMEAISPEMIDFILRMSRQNSFENVNTVSVNYYWGKMLDAKGSREKAIRYYKQALCDVAPNVDSTRNFALNELRKDGFSDEDYTNLAKTGKLEISETPLPQSTEGWLCTMLLQEYGEHPEEVLEKTDEQSIPDGVNLQKTDALNGFWKVSAQTFRDKTWDEKQLATTIWVTQNELQFRGIGVVQKFAVKVEETTENNKRIELVNKLAHKKFRGLINIEGDNATLCLNLLENGAFPESMASEKNSNHLVLQLRK